MHATTAAASTTSTTTAVPAHHTLLNRTAASARARALLVVRLQHAAGLVACRGRNPHTDHTEGVQAPPTAARGREVAGHMLMIEADFRDQNALYPSSATFTPRV